MQISPRSGELIEKVIYDTDGRLVRATFYVYQVGTRVRARLIKAVFLDEALTLKEKKVFLPGFSTAGSYSETLFTQKPVESVYWMNPLRFSGSKPRAPTR